MLLLCHLIDCIISFNNPAETSIITTSSVDEETKAQRAASLYPRGTASQWKRPKEIQDCLLLEPEPRTRPTEAFLAITLGDTGFGL